MSKHIKALLEQRAVKVTAMEAALKTAKAEERALTDDENAAVTDIESAIAVIDASVKTLKAAEAAEQAPDGGEAEGEGEGREQETAEQIETRETTEFAQFIRESVSGRGITRALDLGSNGAVVPKTIANKIIAAVYEISPIVAKANRYTTKGTFSVPEYTEDGSDAIAVAYQNEFTDLTSAVGEFGSVNYQNFLAGALAKISNSLINNTDIDIVAKVVDLIAQGFARFLEHEILIGTSGKATGLSTLTNVLTVTAIDYDSLVDLTLKVKSAYRKGAFFIGSTNALGVVRKLKDDNHNPIFTNDAQAGFSGKVLGYDFYESDSVADVVDGGKTLYFINPQAVGVRTANDVEIAVLRELFAAQHATGINGWLDFDAKLENHQAVAVLESDAIES